MPLEVLNTLGALRRIDAEWRTLALCTPMQSPDWLVSWWEAFGEDDPNCELATLAVRDDAGVLIGLAPWYLRGHALAGPTLRFLGDGRAATDHPTLLRRSPEDEPAVVATIAKWLVDGAAEVWRRLRFEAIDTDDRAMNQLERLLAEADLDVERIEDCGSFLVEMAPEGVEPTLDNYLTTLSKNRRKRLRRWEREWFDTGRAVVRVATTETERAELWPLLVKLHHERRAALGYVGVFDDERFNRFHQSASERLLAAGQLRLALLELDGAPAAVDYVLQDHRSLYVYQGGISDAGVELEAGHLLQLDSSRTALAAGRTQVDLLRGDEPYKLNWGATHRPAYTLHVRPRDTAGVLERWASSTYRSWRDRDRGSSQEPVISSQEA
jgi:CelD/BcsL family acetyltransferase involved in cellulose biosynthesis